MNKKIDRHKHKQCRHKEKTTPTVPEFMNPLAPLVDGDFPTMRT